MKKLFLTLALLFLATPVLAEEGVQQLQEAKDVKGAIVIKKQPTQEGIVQVQRVEKVYGSIIIFCQGKTPFDSTEKGLRKKSTSTETEK